MLEGKFEEIPLVDLGTPRDGYVCMLNRFWLIGPGGGALSYTVSRPSRKRPDQYPQCNTAEGLAKRWVERCSAGAVGYKFIPVAYWPPVQE